ncbi:MAG: hypothetical protein H7343_10615 [Undibacterium sp.]|nr:hypothetical protein [Opitutaceae bacterium]
MPPRPLAPPARPSLWLRFLPALRAWLVGALAAGALFAGEPARKAFDLKAAGAEEALRKFAQQAGVELVFTVDNVEGVRTRAVKGRFTIREALDRMLMSPPPLRCPRRSNGRATRQPTGDSAPKISARAVTAFPRPRQRGGQ